MPYAGGLVPVPQGRWLHCPACGADGPVVRYWQFHTRPGAPTVRHRCDVSVKCTACAALWVHGVAVPVEWWDTRPKAGGIRRVLMAGSSFEVKVWATGVVRRG